MNRAASITVSPSLLKCHHCCTRQTPLDYDQLKLSWNQFFLSPKWLRSYFRPSGLLRKKRSSFVFFKKGAESPQQLALRWIHSGLIIITKDEHLSLKKPWKRLHPTAFAVSPGAEAPEYFSMWRRCCPHYNKNAKPWLDYYYYVRQDNRKW